MVLENSFCSGRQIKSLTATYTKDKQCVLLIRARRAIMARPASFSGLAVLFVGVFALFGIQGCGGAASCGFMPCAVSGGSVPPPCPPSGTNPLGGFCVAMYDQTQNGVIVPHTQGTATGAWQFDLTNPAGTVKSFNFSGTSVSWGWPQYCSGCRINASWQGFFTFANSGTCSSQPQPWGQTITSSQTTWPTATCELPTSGATFFLSSALPSTLTVDSPGISSSGGLPQITVYAANLAVVSQSSANSVNGTSATFAFPTLGGNPLPIGHYPYVVANQTPSGPTKVAMGFFSIGSISTQYTAPFGVDAADIKTVQTQCKIPLRGPEQCGTTTSNDQKPVLTLSSANQSVGYGTPLSVGAEPVAVKTYRTLSTETIRRFGTSETITTDVTEPTRAIVANFGSDDLSVVDLQANSLLATISVGTEPTAILLSSDQTKAYVANFGSASISVIDLSSNAQVNVISVGASPATLAMDPSGTALWVGGGGYVSKVDLGTLSVVSTTGVSGQVTSLAASAGENALVYTVLSSTSFDAEQAQLSTGKILASYAHEIVSGGQFAAVPGTLSALSAPPAWLTAQGALVTASYGNRYAVTGTPTGFVVIDLQTQTTMLQASTPSAIRGIATDPNQGIIYVTAPDSNMLITVPFPTPPTT